MQRHIYALVPSTNPMNQSSPVHEPRTTQNSHSAHSARPAAVQSARSNAADDSLTNLSWLHDIHILKRTMPTINASPCHMKSEATSLSLADKDIRLPSSPVSSLTRCSLPSTSVDDLSIQNDDQWQLYRANAQAKPIYSYSQLILLALKQSGHEKMTLQMIYEWIADNFPYFQKMEPTWQVGWNCTAQLFTVQHGWEALVAE